MPRMFIITAHDIFLVDMYRMLVFQRINHLKIILIRKAAFFFLKMKKSLKVLILRLDIS